MRAAQYCKASSQSSSVRCGMWQMWHPWEVVKKSQEVLRRIILLVSARSAVVRVVKCHKDPCIAMIWAEVFVSFSSKAIYIYKNWSKFCKNAEKSYWVSNFVRHMEEFTTAQLTFPPQLEEMHLGTKGSSPASRRHSCLTFSIPGRISNLSLSAENSVTETIWWKFCVTKHPNAFRTSFTISQNPASSENSRVDQVNDSSRPLKICDAFYDLRRVTDRRRSTPRLCHPK